MQYLLCEIVEGWGQFVKCCYFLLKKSIETLTKTLYLPCRMVYARFGYDCLL